MEEQRHSLTHKRALNERGSECDPPSHSHTHSHTHSHDQGDDTYDHHRSRSSKKKKKRSKHHKHHKDDRVSEDEDDRYSVTHSRDSRNRRVSDRGSGSGSGHRHRNRDRHHRSRGSSRSRSRSESRSDGRSDGRSRSRSRSRRRSRSRSGRRDHKHSIGHSRSDGRSRGCGRGRSGSRSRSRDRHDDRYRDDERSDARSRRKSSSGGIDSTDTIPAQNQSKCDSRDLQQSKSGVVPRRNDIGSTNNDQPHYMASIPSSYVNDSHVVKDANAGSSDNVKVENREDTAGDDYMSMSFVTEQEQEKLRRKKAKQLRLAKASSVPTVAVSSTQLSGNASLPPRCHNDVMPAETANRASPRVEESKEIIHTIVGPASIGDEMSSSVDVQDNLTMTSKVSQFEKSEDISTVSGGSSTLPAEGYDSTGSHCPPPADSGGMSTLEQQTKAYEEYQQQYLLWYQQQQQQQRDFYTQRRLQQQQRPNYTPQQQQHQPQPQHHLSLPTYAQSVPQNQYPIAYSQTTAPPTAPGGMNQLPQDPIVRRFYGL